MQDEEKEKKECGKILETYTHTCTGGESFFTAVTVVKSQDFSGVLQDRGDCVVRIEPSDQCQTDRLPRHSRLLF